MPGHASQSLRTPSRGKRSPVGLLGEVTTTSVAVRAASISASTLGAKSFSRGTSTTGVSTMEA